MLGLSFGIPREGTLADPAWDSDGRCRGRRGSTGVTSGVEGKVSSQRSRGAVQTRLGSPFLSLA